MRSLHLLLLLTPLLTPPVVPDPPLLLRETSAVRIERFEQLWAACDSVTQEFRCMVGDVTEVGFRQLHYELALYWHAELAAYATLSPREQGEVWARLQPDDPASARRNGEKLHRWARERVLPSTPPVPRRMALILLFQLRDDLIGRGMDPTFVWTVAQLWPPYVDPKRHRFPTVALLFSFPLFQMPA